MTTDGYLSRLLDDPNVNSNINRALEDVFDSSFGEIIEDINSIKFEDFLKCIGVNNFDRKELWCDFPVVKLYEDNVGIISSVAYSELNVKTTYNPDKMMIFKDKDAASNFIEQNGRNRLEEHQYLKIGSTDFECSQQYKAIYYLYYLVDGVFVHPIAMVRE